MNFGMPSLPGTGFNRYSSPTPARRSEKEVEKEEEKEKSLLEEVVSRLPFEEAAMAVTNVKELKNFLCVEKGGHYVET